MYICTSVCVNFERKRMREKKREERERESARETTADN